MPVEYNNTIKVVVPDKGEIDLVIRVIKSSNVDWIGWPKSGEPLMVVEFQGGTRYAYLGVSRQQAVAASWATSTGQYIARRIKPKFKVVKLR